jgi:hypothetical protein
VALADRRHWRRWWSTRCASIDEYRAMPAAPAPRSPPRVTAFLADPITGSPSQIDEARSARRIIVVTGLPATTPCDRKGRRAAGAERCAAVAHRRTS